MSEVRQSGIDEPAAAAGVRYPAEINLFEMPALTNTYVSEDYIDYRPRSANLNSGANIEYVIPPSISQFTSLRDTRHHVRVQILHADSSKLDVDEVVGFVQWPAVSIFDSCMVSLNQQLVSCTGGLDHGFRGIIQALLDRHRFEKDTALQAGLYVKDTANKMNDFVSQDTGFMERWQYVAGSEPVDLVAPIISDVAEQSRLLLPNLEISLSFHPASASFCLCTAAREAEYRVHILDSFLRVKRKTAQPAVLLALSSALELTPAVYPYMKTEMRKFLSLHSFTQESLFESQVPSHMVIGFVKADAVAGDLHSNPYCFETAGINSINLFLDDKPVTPGFKLDYSRTTYLQSDFMDGFQSLYSESSDESDLPSSYCDITRSDYAQGFTLYVTRFNSASSARFLPVQPQANLKVNVQFRRPPEENLQMIIYARFASILHIDKTRRITI